MDKALKGLSSRRFISISTLSNTVTSNQKTITTNENIQNVNKLSLSQTVDAPTLTPIDQSVLSVELPPSIPIYMKRGSLISIFGISNLSTASLTHSLSSWGYQKLISTSKISLLLTSNSSNWFNLARVSNTKALSILNLDGTNDWALFNAPHFYVGDSLIKKNYLIPSRVSKRLSKALKVPSNTRTGLFNWFKYHYTLATGRGQIGIVGKGSIYNINLVENEEILINKDNLLAITVNGPYDLQNCIIKYEPLIHQVPETPANVEGSPKQFQDYLQSVTKFLGIARNKTSNYLIGNQDFVKVLGPRNILIQSDNNHRIPEFPEDDLKKSVKQFSHKANDYLNYVNVRQTDTTITSTKNFRS